MSRRFGQPAATMAGIEACAGRACIVLDADLQDPPEIIPALVDKWREGYQVVFAQRRSRRGERRSKRVVAYIGYWLISRISDVPIPRDTGDCRLIDRKVIDVLRLLPEKHGFLRGLVAFAGYKQTVVSYDRDTRASGVSKYHPSFGSVRIGINGVTAFSSKPLTLVLVAGFGLAAFALVVALWYLLEKLYLDPDITPGLATTVIFISLFSALQLIGLGIVGAYVGRIYNEVLGRPMYVVADRVNFERDEPTQETAAAMRTTTVRGPSLTR
jgi:glycosyltransferase involved in cell wall biosynthesis